MPEIIKEGTNLETSKSDCSKFLLRYRGAFANVVGAEFDPSEEILFSVTYVCVHSESAEMGVGNEGYKLNISTNKITYMGELYFTGSGMELR